MKSVDYYKLKQIEEICDQAFDLRNEARKSVDNYELYLEAAEKFKYVIDFQQKSLKLIKRDDIHKLSPEIQCGIYKSIATNEHLQFERYNCIAVYNYMQREYKEAIEYGSKVEKHIDNAIEALHKIDIDRRNVCNKEEINYDIKRWTYYKLENNVRCYIYRAEDEAKKENYMNSIDYYRIAVKKMKQLINEMPKYEDVLETEYYRILQSNYLAMLSNTSYEMINLMKSTYVQHSNNEISLIDILIESWNAYTYTELAYKNNPIWTDYKDVREVQISLLEKLLRENMDSWKSIYIKFEDNKEFLKVMKKVDSKKYNKVEAELKLNDNNAFKLWKMGSFWILLFLILSGVVGILAKIIAFWTFLAAITAIEIILIIVGGFTLKSMDSLSESGFIKLISIATKNQLSFLKIFRKDEEK